MKYYAKYNIYVEVDQKKEECLNELPHCHVIKNGKIVAQVWLKDNVFEGASNLNKEDERAVLDVVRVNSYKLYSEYRDNALNGVD